MFKLLWTIEKIQLLAEIYKERAKQEAKRKKEFEDKARALIILVEILKQIPVNRS